MSLRLHTTLEPTGPACAIILSDDQVAALGGGKRAAVRVTIGDRTSRLRLAVMGGKNLIGLSKASRTELGVEIGDQVEAVIDLDESPREVVVPEELAQELTANDAARAAYEAMTYTHRREYAEWVAQAKKEETRLRRASKAIEMITAGQSR